MKKTQNPGKLPKKRKAQSRRNIRHWFDKGDSDKRELINYC